MPINIDATFQNLESIGLDTFRGADGAGSLADKTIRVGNHRYNVSFADNGKVNVSFAATSFMHLFQGSAKAAVQGRIQELVDLLSLKRDLGSVVVATSQVDNVKNVIRAQAESISNTGNGAVAHYGFSSVRETAAREIVSVAQARSEAHAQDPNVKPMGHQLINSYNVAIGLGETVNVATTILFMRDAPRGKWPISNGTDGVGKQDTKDWFDYLVKNGRDVDLFSKIRLAIDEAAKGKTTGWAGVINEKGLDVAVHDMVRKNLDPRVIAMYPDVNFVLDGISETVLDIANANFDGMNEAQVTDAIKQSLARHVPPAKAQMAFEILNNVATSAFWRQTSKLGLDFFKARGQTVVFEWTKYNGEQTDEAELRDKWWKQGDADVTDHFGVAITNSEMRHLQGKKYAKKDGPGTVVKIEGGLNRERAEALVESKVNELRKLSDKELDTLSKDLTADFDKLTALDFHDAARHLIPTLQPVAWHGWVNGSGIIDDDMTNMIAAAFERVKSRVAATASPLVRSAMLMNISTLFEAELLKDPTIQEELHSAEASAPKPDEDQVNLRKLAALDHGRGIRVFFASDSGAPNALGILLLREARGGGDVATLAEEIAKAFGEKFGCTPEEALQHPAFKTFLPRAATDDMARLLKSMDVVHDAYVAKEALRTRLREKGTGIDSLSAPEREVYARRGDWDLNRLVFNAAVAAKSSGRAVDVDSLAQQAHMVQQLCKNALAFAQETGHQLGAPLSEAEMHGLEDAYLDRENSAAVHFRLYGKERKTGEIEAERQKVLGDLAELAAKLNDPALKLTAPAKVGFITQAIACRAKPLHVDLALGGFRALLAHPPVVARTGTVAERLEAFALNLSAHLREGWDDVMRPLVAQGKRPDFAYDDQTTFVRMAFAAFTGDFKDSVDFLKGVDSDTATKVAMKFTRDQDPLIENVFDVLRTFGRL